MAECLTVDQDVAGSTPVSHPKRQASLQFLPFPMKTENRMLFATYFVKVIYLLIFRIILNPIETNRISKS